jgi:hypothetical protein
MASLDDSDPPIAGGDASRRLFLISLPIPHQTHLIHLTWEKHVQILRSNRLAAALRSLVRRGWYCYLQMQTAENQSSPLVERITVGSG